MRGYYLCGGVGVVVLAVLGCGGGSSDPGTSGDGHGGSGSSSGATTGDPATGGGSATGGAGGQVGNPDAPTAIFAPEPPTYWYVDAVPLTIGVAGAGVTHYRYAIDDAEWSAEQPIATPLSIPALAPGKRTLKIIGRNAANKWQELPTQASFHMATTGDEPTACKLVKDGGTCDFLLTAPGGFYATSKHFYDANKDGVPDYEKLLDIKPGSRVCLQAGAYDTLNLRGFEGAPRRLSASSTAVGGSTSHTATPTRPWRCSSRATSASWATGTRPSPTGSPSPPRAPSSRTLWRSPTLPPITSSPASRSRALVTPVSPRAPT